MLQTHVSREHLLLTCVLGVLGPRFLESQRDSESSGKVVDVPAILQMSQHGSSFAVQGEDSLSINVFYISSCVTICHFFTATKRPVIPPLWLVGLVSDPRMFTTPAGDDDGRSMFDGFFFVLQFVMWHGPCVISAQRRARSTAPRNSPRPKTGSLHGVLESDCHEHDQHLWRM